MTGREKRQSGSEATKRSVFPGKGNAVPYGRQPVENIFFDNRFLVVILKNRTFAFERWRLPIGRVVYRGNNNANPNGGVSMSNANNDSSNTNTNIGSRLNNNRKEISIGVQHRGLVPTVVSRGASRSNSGLLGRKTEKQSVG